MPIFNIFAALATGVASMVIGFIWYGPLFSKMWMKEVGLSEKEVENGPGAGYAIAFASSTFLGSVMSYLVIRFGIMSALEGAMFGLIIGLGFVFTTFTTNYIFARRSLKLFAIDAGYQTLLVVVAGLIAVLIR